MSEERRKVNRCVMSACCVISSFAVAVSPALAQAVVQGVSPASAPSIIVDSKLLNEPRVVVSATAKEVAVSNLKSISPSEMPSVPLPFAAPTARPLPTSLPPITRDVPLSARPAIQASFASPYGMRSVTIVPDDKQEPRIAMPNGPAFFNK